MKRDLPAFVYAKGKRGYLYFIRPGVCERIHDKPGTAAFAATYARLMQGSVVTPQKTIRKLIRAYMASRDWEALADATKRSYRRSMTYLDEVMAHVDPASLRPSHVIRLREALADKPSDANLKVRALGSLLQYGVRHDWLTSNPVREVRLSNAHVQKHRVWPANVVEAFRENATGQSRLIFELLLGTGQRIGDVLRMQWAHIEDGGIVVRQGKTGTRIWVPHTPRLAAVLAETPRIGLFIVSQANGKPLSYQRAWEYIAAVRKEIDGMDYDIHGLRHTAASEIAALPGMTIDHVKAITGHKSAAMASHYSFEAAQRARAKEAQKGRK